MAIRILIHAYLRAKAGKSEGVNFIESKRLQSFKLMYEHKVCKKKGHGHILKKKT